MAVSSDVTESPDAKPTYAVGSLDRALDLLETLAEMPDAQLVDLSARLGVNKATAFRHLHVLQARGYVARDGGTKRYSLGPRLLELGYTAHRQLALPKVAEPAMQALRARFDETVHLGVLADWQVVHIEVVPSTHVLTMASEIGERTYAHATALGKTLLAWTGPDAIPALLDGPGLVGQTQHTLTDPEVLERELVGVRERGYATDDRESSEGVRCLAAPIRKAGGEVIAALSLSGPAERMPDSELPAMATGVIEAADEISRRCGWPPKAGATA